MQQHGWTSKSYSVEEAWHKKSTSVWFLFHKILENSIYSDRQQTSGFLGPGLGKEGTTKGHEENFESDENAPYLDYGTDLMSRQPPKFITLYNLKGYRLYYVNYNLIILPLKRYNREKAVTKECISAMEEHFQLPATTQLLCLL